LNGTVNLNKYQGGCTPHDDGCVLEVPKSGSKTGQMLPPVQSARIQTKGTFSFKYGRMEVKTKFPKGKWLWPAIWMLSDENKYGDDQDGGIPFSGEIDIIEPRGHP
jgi:beta-glucanase (GH16 family)